MTTTDRQSSETILTRRLPAEFYEREKHDLALALLGRDLVRRYDGRLFAGRIVEVEVYGGPHDPACHADSGEPTERTRAMFGPPGQAYVYQIYGMYHCLNVVAPAEQKAAAILIRALEPLTELETMASNRGLSEKYDAEMTLSVRKNLLSGPGKLCQAMQIDGDLDERSLQSDQLWIAPGEPILQTAGETAIESSPRIGLNPETVGEAAEWRWRYVDTRSAFLSR